MQLQMRLMLQLLDFQLESHERFLSRFVHLFKQYDTDRNGIVNEHEFRQVLKARFRRWIHV